MADPEVVDEETLARAKRGVRPDLIGWKAMANELDVSEDTVQALERDRLIQVVGWGRTQVAAYSDRLRACAMAAREKARARRRNRPA